MSTDQQDVKPTETTAATAPAQPQGAPNESATPKDDAKGEVNSESKPATPPAPTEETKVTPPVTAEAKPATPTAPVAPATPTAPAAAAQKPVAPVQQPPKQSAVVTTPVAPAKSKVKELDKPVLTTKHIVGITDRLNRFVSDILPSAGKSDTDVGKLHEGLSQAYQIALGKEGESFDEAITVILDTIAANLGGAFDPYVMYRHINMARLNGDTLRTYERLQRLFTATCDAKSRAIALKQIDLKQVIRYMDGPRGERLVTFFRKFQTQQ